MIGILAEKIHDNRFLRLLRNMLTAGYLEDWTWNATLSGVPQGGIASPVLSNIYLHKLDVFVEKTLIPEFTRGRLRARNPEYRAVEHAIAAARRKGDRAEVRSLYRRLHSLPSQDPDDPGYRRLRYCRYADDTLLGFAGPKAEAEEIKRRLAQFLRDDLRLELSPDKTLITHARSQRARFLGYEIAVASSATRTRRPSKSDGRNRRSLNGTVVLHVPAAVVKAKSAPYLSRGKPACRNPMINDSDYNIVARFGAEYRGIVQYYLLAGDVFRLHRLRWVMETSMLKHPGPQAPLDGVEDGGPSQGQDPDTARAAHAVRGHGRARGQETTGRLVRRNPAEAAEGRGPHRPPAHRARLPEPAAGHPAAQRQMRALRANRRHPGSPCPGARRPRPARPPQPLWAQAMAKIRRKSLVVCDDCHDLIHGQPATPLTH